MIYFTKQGETKTNNEQVLKHGVPVFEKGKWQLKVMEKRLLINGNGNKQPFL